MTDPPLLSEMAPKLTEREIAVAALVARRYTAKHIACTLGIKTRRVYTLIAGIAYKLGWERGITEEREIIRDWWLAQVPVRDKDAA